MHDPDGSAEPLEPTAEELFDALESAFNQRIQEEAEKIENKWGGNDDE